MATFHHVEVAARDEVIANGGSVSHHHGSAFFTLHALFCHTEHTHIYTRARTRTLRRVQGHLLSTLAYRCELHPHTYPWTYTPTIACHCAHASVWKCVLTVVVMCSWQDPQALAGRDHLPHGRGDAQGRQGPHGPEEHLRRWQPSSIEYLLRLALIRARTGVS